MAVKACSSTGPPVVLQCWEYIAAADEVAGIDQLVLERSATAITATRYRKPPRIGR
jgi:hypothetical protein